MILGAHVSIAGSITKAPERAYEIGGETFQIFTKNQMQWCIPTLTEKTAEKFKNNVKSFNLSFGTVHASYLVNVASSDPMTRMRSINNLVVDLERAELLNMPYLIFHPGAHKGAGEKNGIKLIAEAIDQIFDITSAKRTMLLLETTAGSGTNLGYRLEQLSEIIARTKFSDRVGVCVDTCHIFAAGYDIRTESGIVDFMDLADKSFGLGKIKAFHLNDSLGKLGSRIDRHAEIGKGSIGTRAFEVLVNLREFENTPGILETPGGPERYKVNLQLLKTFRR